MDPFIQYPTYRILVCQSCRIAVFPSEVARHLKDHHEHTPKQCQELAYKARSYQQIIQTPKQWESEGTFPPPKAAVIPLLAVYQNGIQCKSSHCHYTTRSPKAMKNHCQSQHGWVNPYGKGGSLADRRKHEYPWHTEVNCQRFFNHGAHQQYFAVAPPAPKPSSAPPTPSFPVGSQQMLQRIQQKQAEIASQSTVQANQKLDANPWLNRAGWAQHLAGIPWAQLAELNRKPQEEEITLQVMYEVLANLIRKAQEYVMGPWCPLHNRFELQRIELGKDPKIPFEGRMEPDTFERYVQVGQRILGYVYRTHRSSERRYSMLPARQVPWDVFVGLAEGLDVEAIPETLHPVAPRESANTPPILTTLERACLDVWIAWLDDPMASGEYQNPIISGLAVLGYDARAATWVTPLNYTAKLSAVIKLARMMIAMYASDRYRTCPLDVQRSIQRHVRRFGVAGEPSPMHWVIHLRRYGLAIRRTTTAAGTIRWEGHVVSHGRTRLDIHDFRAGVHGLHNDCRRRLLEDLFCVESAAAVPVIPWDRLEDFPAEQQIGFSFLQDSRIPWPVTGEQWLFGHLVSEANPAGILGRGYEGSQELGSQGWSRRHVRQYMRSIAQFKERLAILIHLSSGQPARATELLSIRYRNTAEGGTRNVFIEHQQVAIVTAYHKGYQIDNSVKIVHRYLPREVGELLIWYLWLVQPFQRQLEIVMEGRMWDTGYLWEQGLHDRPWIRDRITRTMERETAQGMGVRLTIAAYRQLAIAMARRYLQGLTFIDDHDDHDEDVEDEIGDEATQDNPIDLQAGHSSHMAGMIYARGLMEGLGHIETKRHQFRAVSHAWHRFLQFPSAVEAGSLKRKRVLEQQDQDMLRWKRLRQVNLQTMLQKLVGPTAQFRGIQEAAIQAIMAGTGLTVAVMGTGGGKSLLFMLPAMCSAQVPGMQLRVTVVIVPMVSLRQDLHARCQQVGIICSEWDSRKPQEHTSIMLITPESAVTAGFQAYLNRMKAQQLLDRIVVDECHYILDCGEGFRAKVRELPELWAIECQLVMLTATLPPTDEEEFFQRMQMPRELVTMFRASTSRPNLRYTVLEAEGDQAQQDAFVHHVVHDCLSRHPDGKVILYCLSKPHVRRLAEQLQCPAYYSDVTAKVQVFTEILEATCTVVVATSALGLGINIPNIRAVIHVGGFRHLRDFAQESGRAGRDGLVSESIVIARAHTTPNPATLAWVQGIQCCRVILDEYLDGDTSRDACRDNEERCWVCERVSAVQGSSDSSLESPVSEDASAAIQSSNATTPASSVQQLRQHVQRQVQDEATGVAGVADAVQAWMDICPLCRIRQLDCDHLLADCPQPEAVVQSVQQAVRQMLVSMEYAPYSACFRCGMPQWICLRFVSNGTGGWVQQEDDLCEGHGMIVTVVMTAMIAIPAFGQPLMQQLQHDSVNLDSDKAVGKWFGRKIQWGSTEAAYIHRVFWEFHEFWTLRQHEGFKLCNMNLNDK